MKCGFYCSSAVINGFISYFLQNQMVLGLIYNRVIQVVNPAYCVM